MRHVLVGLVLTGAICALEARLLVTRPSTLVGFTFVRAASNPDPRLESEFTGHMTTDDVARGIYGLAAETGSVALTTEQRAAILPLLQEGAALRSHLGELREKRRATRERLIAELAP